MTVLQLYDFINNLAPFELTENWDNSGILIGNPHKIVRKCYICLDATPNIIDEAIINNVDLIITHHPIIFSPLKKILCNDLQYKLIKNDIAVISAHTNLDKSINGINDILIQKLNLLKIDNPSLKNSFIRIGKLPSPISPIQFASLVKQNLNCQYVKLLDANNIIEYVAVVSGAGGSLFNDILNLNVDAFVTSDVKHNIFIDALNSNLTIVDAGHFETENIVSKNLLDILSLNFNNIIFQIPENNISPIIYV